MENENKPIQFEELLKFLIDNSIAAHVEKTKEVGFNRTIAFSVYGVNYRIIWFTNESTLMIGDSQRAARIPFKYAYLDTSYPLIDGNKSIGFSYTKHKRESIFDSEYPYEAFRIPIELTHLQKDK